jgi:hypothetical protein
MGDRGSTALIAGAGAAAGTIGTTMILAGASNAWNPVGWGLIIAGAATSMFGSYKQSQQQSAAASMYEQSARQIEQQNVYIEESNRMEAEAHRSRAKTYQANAAQLKVEARINEVIGQANETLQEREALYIKKSGQQKALAIQREVGRVEGAQYTSTMHGNMIMEGTPLTLLQETADLAAEDIANVLESASLAEQDAHTQASLYRLAGQRGAASSYGAAANQYAGAAGSYQSASSVMAMLPYELSANNFKAWQMRSQAALMDYQAGTTLLTGIGSGLTGFGSMWMRYGPRNKKRFKS